MPILIKTDGSRTEVMPKNGKSFKLQELYELLMVEVVERVFMGESMSMWVDEEGKLNGSKINYEATKEREKIYGKTDVIFGNALLTENHYTED